MKKTTAREKHIRNSIEKVTVNLQDAILTAAIQGRKIEKIDFTGCDLRLHMEGGTAWIFSAMLNDNSRPVIEFASTGLKAKGIDYEI